MTNLFGSNITENKNNYNTDANIFITKTLDPDIQKRWENTYAETQSLLKKAAPPQWLTVVIFIIFIVSGFSLLNIFFDALEIGIDGFSNSLVRFLLSLLGLAVVVVLAYHYNQNKKKLLQSDEAIQNMQTAENIMNEVYTDLGIPESAESIDILAGKYKISKENVKEVNFSSEFTHYNFSVSAYIRNSMLCLCDLHQVYEIPLNSIKKAELQKKKCSFPKWNKNKPYSSPEYKKYKIVLNGGMYTTKCYRITIEDIKGNFYLLIPNYDMEYFSSLTKVYPEN